jgi:hypothetical protein
MTGTVFRQAVRGIPMAAAVSTASLAFAVAAGFSAVPTSRPAPPAALAAVYTPPTPIVPPSPIAPRLPGQPI